MCALLGTKTDNLFWRVWQLQGTNDESRFLKLYEVMEPYFKIPCPECEGGIEFPAHGVGEQAACPHCQQSIVLRFPAAGEYSAAQQIDLYLRTSSFPKTRA